jgi:DNA-binding transcriptional LysR family regulator
LLRLSDEAFTSVATPSEVGTVRLGVPDDYAAFLLPPTLARFAAEHPLVAIELVCQPSARLNQLIDRAEIDLAIVTRTPEQTLAVLRQEPFVWVASERHAAWEKDPLPIAVFEEGCTAYLNVMDALEATGKPFRKAYSSSSLFGLLAAVQAGLAVAGLARCSIPPSLKIINEREGLPALRPLQISILRKSARDTIAVERLAEFLQGELAFQAS